MQTREDTNNAVPTWCSCWPKRQVDVRQTTVASETDKHRALNLPDKQADQGGPDRPIELRCSSATRIRTWDTPTTNTPARMVASEFDSRSGYHERNCAVNF